MCLRVVHHGTKRTYNFKFDGHAVNIRNTLSVNQPNPHVAAAGRLIARGNTVVEPSLQTTLRQEGLIQHIAPDSCVSLLSLHHLGNLYLGGSYETCE